MILDPPPPPPGLGTCAQCRFYALTEYADSRDPNLLHRFTGCRRRAPLSTTVSSFPSWPQVAPTDWCGEWEARA